MKVAAIIPTYNRADGLVECVRSVLSCDSPGLFTLEVAVVDDASPDDTADKVRQAFGGDGRVRYIRNARNSRQAASRNNGAKTAPDADWLLFVDDDNTVAPDMVRELLAAAGRHPRAGIIAPLALQDRRNGAEPLSWTLGSDFNRWTSQPRDVFANVPVSRLPASAPDGGSDWPTTYSPNAFMVRRDVFDRLGGFDEGFGMMYEESDFGWRAIEAGSECWIAANARTLHKGFVEPGCCGELRLLGIEKPSRAYCFARNRVKFARRHFSFLQALCVAFVFAPLSALYYGAVALRNRRIDVAWAYLRGTFAGILQH